MFAYIQLYEERKEMKFDFCIGNPPYQEDRRGDTNTTLPVYHDFMEAAYELAKSVELITPARFLFNAGRTPKEWNDKMLNDKHLKVLSYMPDSAEVFNGVEIKGGVAITYRDSDKSFGAIGTFTTHDELNSLIQKIVPHVSEGKSLESISFVATKFNTSNLFSDYPQYSGHERRMSSNVLTFDCFHKTQQNNDVMIYGILGGQRSKRYISQMYVDSNDPVLAKYKIVTPKADGKGSLGETLTNPEILPPQSGFTHTFLGIGCFDTGYEATACLKYIKTKFARTLLGVLKITQDLNANKWKYVPLQDFTPSSDIDWSQSVANIDRQLYKKYGLSESEIEFIETHVKEMK